MQKLRKLLHRYRISFRKVERGLNYFICFETLRKWMNGKPLARKSEDELMARLKQFLTIENIPEKEIEEALSEINNHKKEVETMLSQEAMQHFNLADDPFSGELENSGDVFWNKELENLKQAIKKGIEDQIIIAGIGPYGCGKTTVLTEVKEEWDNRDDIIISESLMPDKERLGLIDIAEDLIYVLSAGTERPKRSRNARMRQLLRLLEYQMKRGKKVAVIVDNSEDLYIHTINALRKMRDILKIGRKATFSLIFLGQPKLKAMLDRAPDVGSRVKMTMVNTLNGKASDYLEFKLKRMEREDLFNKPALLAVNQRLDCGSFLETNNLAAKALNLASRRGLNQINEEIINSIR